MPIESVILLTGVTAYYSRVCSSAEFSYAFITTTLEEIAIVYTNPSFLFLSYMTRAWGMPSLFVHSLFFTHLMEGWIL